MRFRFPKLFVWGFREIKRPSFPVDDELEARAKAIRFRQKLKDPKPLYVREWARDANGSPIDWDDFKAPIG